MSTIIANNIDRIERKVEAKLDDRLCRNCRSLLEVEQYDSKDFERESQVWTCRDCGRARQWGFRRPWDQYILPLLNCEHCECETRHQFLRVA
jgi:RNase P subunit RPR2